jgi:C-terminal processing protease CtpA/Prc
MLEEDLRATSSDAHLHVFFSIDPPPSPPPPGGTPPRALVAELRRKDLHGGILERKVLPGNIGYLALWGVPMVEVSRDDIAEAFAFLHGTAALILDNRQNRGGDPHTVALYLSYLTEGPAVVYNQLIGRDDVVLEEFKTSDLGPLSYGQQKPVYVLTSQETFSGGEGLSYHLQALKRAVVIGERTRGGGRRSEIISLGRNLYASIPFAQGRSPFTGRNWEGVGVQPDVMVPAAEALSAAQRAATAALKPSRD